MNLHLLIGLGLAAFVVIIGVASLKRKGKL